MVVLGAGSDWGQPYSCGQWSNKFDLTYPLIDDTSNDLFFDFAWDGNSNSSGNQYYVPMNIIYDHNMVISYRAYGFNETAVKNKIEDLINAMPTVGTIKEMGNIASPIHFEISDIYPNPFNSQTNLSLTVSKPTVANVIIYNSVGKEILKLVRAKKFEIGRHKISWKPDEKISSGLYIVLVQSPLGRDVTKVIMLK